MKSILLLTLSSLFLIGCASRPIPTSITQAPVGDLQLTEAISNIEQHKSTNVRWGGTIIGYNEKDGASYIEVMQAPLGQNGRPLISQSTNGRFMVVVPKPDESVKDEALDIYVEIGGLMTINGNIQDEIEVMVGKNSTQIPLVSVNDIYTWRSPGDYYNDPYNYGYHRNFHGRFFFHGGRYYPFYSPYYRPYHRPFYRYRRCP